METWAGATLTIHPSAPAHPGALPERRFLVVLESGSSSLYYLPPGGEVSIGRAREADLRLADSSASRQHARLLIGQDAVRVVDLQSHNGTFVNGERITDARVLARGDAITICSATLILHCDARPPRARTIGEEGPFRQRAAEEVERALRYSRPLAVACLELDPGASRPWAALEICRELRLIDVAAWGGPAQVLVLLPELMEGEASEAVGHLMQALSSQAPKTRAGVATCPADGLDAHTLIAGARAAAAAAPPGQVLSAVSAVTTFEAGDRSIVVAEPAMLRTYELLRRLAGSELPVLVCGETGTGKEFAAAALHHWSDRRGKDLVTLNCAALPEALVESELFGYEKGAFSGAVSARQGLLASADGGTVFLDEVGELPLPTQAKLLRVLEQKRYRRLGDSREREVDIRLVAATNRDLPAEVAAGRFRQDLLFRLGVATVVLLPLRERPRDLPVLARVLLDDACARARRPPMGISAQAMERLQTHTWSGNVRELRNLMEFMAATVPDPVLEAWHLPVPGAVPGPGEEAAAQGAGPPPAAPSPSSERPHRAFRPIEQELRELERTRMVEALEAAGGVQSRAAELIAMPRRTFTNKLKQYGLSRRWGEV